MKKTTKVIIFLFFVILPLINLTPVSYALGSDTMSQFSGGEGTRDNPYLIENAYHLENIKKYPDASFKLISDVDLSTIERWTPIEEFNGIFDGNGYEICNLRISVWTIAEQEENIGLFGKSNGVVKNVQLQNANVYCPSLQVSSEAAFDYAYPNIAGLVGFNSGVISNCGFTGTMEVSVVAGVGLFKKEISLAIGGVCGISTGTVIDCYNEGTITVSQSWGSCVGGVVGVNSKGKVEKCYNLGTIKGWATTGGITGRNYGGVVQNCYNVGRIHSYIDTSQMMCGTGGIVGDNDSGSKVYWCYNVGDITGPEIVCGGIVGFNTYGTNTVYECYHVNTKGIGQGSDTTYACSKEQLQYESTYGGFDFLSVWEINNYTSFQYPQLRTNLHVKVAEFEIFSNSDNLYCFAGHTKSIEDLLVKIKYVDGTECVVDANYHMLKGLDEGSTGKQVCELEYGGKLAKGTVTIDVIPIIIESISVDVSNIKTDYVVGQPLDLSNGKMKLNYNSGLSNFIDLENADFSYDESATGNVAVTVMYSGCKSEFYITVSEKTIDHIAMYYLPDKLTYIEEQEIDITGGSLKIVYNSSDDYSEIIPLSSAVISGFDNTKIGKQTINVEYGGLSTTFTVYVVKKAVNKISLIDDNFKKMYLEGKDEICFSSGTQLFVEYDNGTNDYVNLESEMVQGFDNTIPGIQTLIITYCGKTCTYDIIIVAKTLTSIVVTTVPNKLTYLEGESFESAGMVVTAFYDNENSEIITNYTIAGYNSIPGNKTITITYEDQTTSLSVLVEHFYDGICDRICNICNDIRETDTDHRFVNTCDTDCNICGEIRTIEHTYDGDCDVECNVCSDTREVYVDHTFDNTCDIDCNICGATREITHNYNIRKYDDDYHWFECECGAIDEENRYGHGYSRYFNTDEHWLECFCGHKTEIASHEYDNVLDPICNVCEEEREITFSGWFADGGKWYFYENGNMITNKWKADSKGWVYLGADGAMQTNAWVMDSFGWCYVGANGYCVTNKWMQDSTKKWCYLNANGNMVVNNWVYSGGKWYFMDANGYMVSNVWKKDSNGWCYLGSDGAMKTNTWVKDSNGWCYVGANGYCVTNKWVADSKGWCYLNSNGNMVVNNWVNDNGKWYFMDANGYMISNTTKYWNGKTYYFNANGVCTNP